MSGPGGQNRLDLAGEVFGKLTVIGRAENRGVRTRWLCRCECGNETVARTEDLRGGRTITCGCRKKLGNPKHGGKHTRLYRIWCSIKTRCFNEASADYPNYGGRGIRLCDEWMGFPGFRDGVVAAAGEPPTPRHTLDRIDNNEGYRPGNVRWATKSEQGRNQRGSRMETLHGVRQSLADWADDLRIPYGALLHRLRRGDTFEQAVARGWDSAPDRSRRVKAALAAVETIPTEALEAGGVQRLCEMVEALLGRDDFWKRPDLVGFVPGELDDVADALQALKGKP